MSVEVVSQPAASSYTGIPEELRAYLAARGLRPSFTHYSDDNLSLLFGVGPRPFRIEEIEDGELRERIGKLFPKVEGGYIRRMDAVLAVEPEESWEARTKRELSLAQQREDVHAEIATLANTIREQISGTGFPPKGRGGLPPAFDWGSSMDGAVVVDKSGEHPKGPPSE